MTIFNLKRSGRNYLSQFPERDFKVINSCFLLVMAMILPLVCKGQDNESRDNFTFGFRVGGNYSNVYDSEGEEFVADPKTGLAIGVFATIPLLRQIAIQPELFFSQRGFKSSGRLLGGNYKMTRTSDYIDIPVLLVFRPVNFLSVLAGPQFSYLTRQTNKFDNGSTGIVQEMAFDNEDLRNYTLCFTGGLDVNVNRLVVAGRFGFDLRNNRANDGSSTPRYKNVWYQLSIGYRFN